MKIDELILRYPSDLTDDEWAYAASLETQLIPMAPEDLRQTLSGSWEYVLHNQQECCECPSKQSNYLEICLGLRSRSDLLPL